SSDAIIFTEDCGATNGSTDLAGTLAANRAAIMPSDFGSELKSYAATQGLQTQLMLRGQHELTQIRSAAVLQPICCYYGALWKANNVPTAGGRPAGRLDLWPYPSAADPDLFPFSYRVAWSRPSADNVALPIPAILESLFISCIRAVTQGWEDEE